MYMKQITIVTTTINSPTEATRKYAKIASEDEGFNLVIVGDNKTPHTKYRELEHEFHNVIYLDPDQQMSLYPDLSEAIGWNCIARRNIGYVYAYDTGCDILATVDDDNIPYPNWGKNILVGNDVSYDEYEALGSDYFDPLSVTKDNHLWHRGYPLEHLQIRHNVEYRGKQKKKCLVQANLWDGDPDIDAICRLTYKPCVKYSDITGPYGSKQISPFNSQNTMVAREVIPFYPMFPGIGRMEDIWSSYVAQFYFPNSVIYDVATVFQDRNAQDLVTNLEAEIIGYRNNLPFLESGKDNFTAFLPENTKRFWDVYRRQFPV